MLSKVVLDQPSPRFSLGFLPISSASKDSYMTSQSIDLFSKRAAEANKTASSSSRLSPPNPAGNLGSASIEQAELDGARDDGCTFCEIAAGEQEAYKVSLRRKRFRFWFVFDESLHCRYHRSSRTNLSWRFLVSLPLSPVASQLAHSVLASHRYSPNSTGALARRPQEAL